MTGIVPSSMRSSSQACWLLLWPVSITNNPPREAQRQSRNLRCHGVQSWVVLVVGRLRIHRAPGTLRRRRRSPWIPMDWPPRGRISTVNLPLCQANSLLVTTTTSLLCPLSPSSCSRCRPLVIKLAGKIWLCMVSLRSRYISLLHPPLTFFCVGFSWMQPPESEMDMSGFTMPMNGSMPLHGSST